MKINRAGVYNGSTKKHHLDVSNASFVQIGPPIKVEKGHILCKKIIVFT